MIGVNSNKCENYKTQGFSTIEPKDLPVNKLFFDASKNCNKQGFNPQFIFYTSLPPIGINHIKTDTTRLNLNKLFKHKSNESNVQLYTQLLIWCISARLALLNRRFSSLNTGMHDKPKLSLAIKTLEMVRSDLQHGKLNICTGEKAKLCFRPCLELRNAKCSIDLVYAHYAPVARESQLILVTAQNKINEESKKLISCKLNPLRTLEMLSENISDSDQKEDISMLRVKLLEHLEILKYFCRVIFQTLEDDASYRFAHTKRRTLAALGGEFIYPPSANPTAKMSL